MNIFTYGASMINDVAEDKSKIIMKKFLKETADIYHLKLCLRQFYQKMVYVQNHFRELLHSYESRC